MLRTTLAILVCTTIAACSSNKKPSGETPTPAADAPAATAEQAATFVRKVDRELREKLVSASKAEWDKSTNITPETEKAAASANEALMAYLSGAIKEARRYDDTKGVNPTVARQLTLLKRGSSLPAPDDAAKRKELADIAAKMESLYGTGKYCKGEDCRDLGELSDVLAESRDYDELLDVWQGWHKVGQDIRPLYTRYVELANEGSREIGYTDLGAQWRSGYDMPADDFAKEVERLWEQVKPLYEQLHCHVRARLAEHYGDDKVAADGRIPAHLLGNMWAQEWGNIYPLVEPYKGEASLDVTSALKDQQYNEERMVKLGEKFFTSVGLPALPETFWKRSMLSKPKDREVVCHASAWDVNYNNDLRIKMCIKTNQEDLVTIHHELGHNYYYSQYYKLPILFQEGAHDGFHEAIGDAIALSITPRYLKQVGLLDRLAANNRGLINQQMKDALSKLAFLPFGKLIDQWRWQVFSGQIAPADYNKAWWELRARYQGIEPAVARNEQNFDPGAKYHIPANVPYTRYFLAAVLQYQFHRSMCEHAGHRGALHECSIYGNRAAGERLRQMLALGASKPWPQALQALTGAREMDASAIVDYFKPLMGWLAKQNEGRTCGWK